MPEQFLSPHYYRYPAQVLGCLRSGEITVILCAGNGLANGGQTVALAVGLIPVDLRMPNSEFDVLFNQESLVNRQSLAFARVLRRSELSA